MPDFISAITELMGGQKQAGPAEQATQLMRSGPPPNLLEQAKSEYPLLKNYDIGYKESFGRSRGFLESWPPGEEGAPDLPRPNEFPNDKFGVEIYDPKTTAKDVLGDIISHHLINVDPKIKGIYEDFAKSLKPFQENILRHQYEHAKDNDGEKRPFEDWKKDSGLPGYFRGYTFNQWPDNFNQQAYTPEQMKKLDEVMEYARKGK